MGCQIIEATELANFLDYEIKDAMIESVNPEYYIDRITLIHSALQKLGFNLYSIIETNKMMDRLNALIDELVTGNEILECIPTGSNFASWHDARRYFAHEPYQN